MGGDEIIIIMNTNTLDVAVMIFSRNMLLKIRGFQQMTQHVFSAHVSFSYQKNVDVTGTTHFFGYFVHLHVIRRVAAS